VDSEGEKVVEETKWIVNKVPPIGSWDFFFHFRDIPVGWGPSLRHDKSAPRSLVFSRRDAGKQGQAKRETCVTFNFHHPPPQMVSCAGTAHLNMAFYSTLWNCWFMLMVSPVPTERVMSSTFR
jgi:hypothetical protein